MDVAIRTKGGRHIRPLVTLGSILGVFVLCGGLKVIDRASLDQLTVRPVELTVLAVMLIGPFAWMATLSALNSRNVALSSVDGRLVSTGWTGRTVVIDHPTSAQRYPIGSAMGGIGELMMIAGRPGEPAVVIAPHWWRDEDLTALLHSLHRQLHPGPSITFGQISRMYPKTRLPLSVRRPWLFSGCTVVLVIAYLATMIHLLLTF